MDLINYHYKVYITGKELSDELHRTIESITISSVADTEADSIEVVFSLPRAFFEFIDDLSDDAPLKVELGYIGNYGVFSGVIKKIQPVFTEQNVCRLTLGAAGAEFAMIKLNKVGKDEYVEVTDDQIVSEIAEKYQLTPVVEATPAFWTEQNPRVRLKGESDYSFIKRMAQENGFVFYVIMNELHFHSRGFLNVPSESPTVLTYGDSLLRFTPAVVTKDVTKETTAANIDTNSKEVIDSTTSTDDISNIGTGDKTAEASPTYYKVIGDKWVKTK